MNKHWVRYSIETGDVLFAGSCPECDVPKPKAGEGLLLVDDRVYVPHQFRVENGEVVMKPVPVDQSTLTYASGGDN